MRADKVSRVGTVAAVSAGRLGAQEEGRGVGGSRYSCRTLACGSSEKVVLLSGPAKCELATSTSSASVPFEDKSQHGPVLSPGDVVGDTGKIL
ncbi:hypothetical protein PC112_g14361 [Phytophthora cactorum]|nr:hypothetical protein PC112_g14361 [Phytophthora cactorum]